MWTSDISIRRLGIVTAVWGIVFAGFHFYWAAGGGAAYEGTPSLGESLYIAFIAVLGLAGAAVAHGLYQPWGTRVGRRGLRRTRPLRRSHPLARRRSRRRQLDCGRLARRRRCERRSYHGLLLGRRAALLGAGLAPRSVGAGTTPPGPPLEPGAPAGRGLRGGAPRTAARACMKDRLASAEPVA
jgi:hypothetical protein